MTDLNERINELNSENQVVAKNYFSNGNMLQNIFDIVRKNFDIIDPIGNYSSDIMLVINTDLSLKNKVIQIIKKFYDANGANIYDIYLTNFAKTNNEKINNTLLQKEIQILKPKRIIYLGFNITQPNIHFMSKVDFDVFSNSLGDTEKITSNEYIQAKNVFVELMKYIITGAE